MKYLEEVAQKGRYANPFFMMMGVEIAGYGEGSARLTMEVRPDMLNGAGWLQGGMYTALADEAMALALYTHLREGERIATVSESTSYLSGAKEGIIHAEGRVLRKGRRVAFTEGVVRRGGPEGEILSRTNASFAVIGS